MSAHASWCFVESHEYRTRFAATWLAAACGLLVACGPPEGGIRGDAGDSFDAGSSLDASRSFDASESSFDASDSFDAAPAIDGGPSVDEDSSVERDSGTETFLDATAPMDAGDSVDAGMHHDAATHDAATSSGDSGAAPSSHCGAARLVATTRLCEFQPLAVRVRPNGEIIAAGAVEDSLRCGTGSDLRSYATGDGLGLVRLDPSGRVVSASMPATWFSTLSDREKVNALDLHGDDVVIAGAFDSSITFPSLGTTLREPRMCRDGYLARVRPDGSVAWVVQVGASAGCVDSVSSVAVAPDGSIYAAGQISSPARFGAIEHAWAESREAGFVMRLASSGEVLWVRFVRTPDNNIPLLVPDSEGVYFAAQSTLYSPGSSVRVEDGVGGLVRRPLMDFDGVLGRYTASGALEWLTLFPGSPMNLVLDGGDLVGWALKDRGTFPGFSSSDQLGLIVRFDRRTGTMRPDPIPTDGPPEGIASVQSSGPVDIRGDALLLSAGWRYDHRFFTLDPLAPGPTTGGMFFGCARRGAPLSWVRRFQPGVIIDARFVGDREIIAVVDSRVGEIRTDDDVTLAAGSYALTYRLDD